MPALKPEPEPESPRLHGGELNQAITSALVGIHNKYLGRGPRSALTFYHDNVIVTLMYGCSRTPSRLSARRTRERP